MEPYYKIVTFQSTEEKSKKKKMQLIKFGYISKGL